MTAWLMVMLTSAYVVATLAIYRSNRQTAKAAQKQAAASVLQAQAIQKQVEATQQQIEMARLQVEVAQKQADEFKRQFKENLRARVTPKLEIVKDRILYLTFHNIGHTIATNLRIEISQPWLECLKNGPFHSSYLQLTKLCEGNQCLLIDSKCTAQICDLFNAESFQKLCEIPLEIKISFTSGKDLYEKVYLPSISIMKPSVPMLVG